MPSHPSESKARKILSHGSVRGNKFTSKQRGLFGAIAGGQRLRRDKAFFGHMSMSTGNPIKAVHQ